MYHIWHFFRNLPFIKQTVEKRMRSTTGEVEQQLQKGLEDRQFIQKLPKYSWDNVS